MRSLTERVLVALTTVFRIRDCSPEKARAPLTVTILPNSEISRDRVQDITRP